MTDKPNNSPLDQEDPLVKKLINEVDEAEWSMLAIHYDRGAIVFIDPQLDIIDVAVKVIRDQVDIVKDWTDQGLVYNPKEKDIEVDKSIKYSFIITQPYVLIQPIIQE